MPSNFSSNSDAVVLRETVGVMDWGAHRVVVTLEEISHGATLPNQSPSLALIEVNWRRRDVLPQEITPRYVLAGLRGAEEKDGGR